MNMDTLKVAELCHETNRAFCKSIGDDSQPPWAEAPEWQKGSAAQGVMLHVGSVEDVSPSASHENWLAQKYAEGWVHGEVKDPEKKTHPCMVNYEELPTEQKSKDYIFGAICKFFKDKL